MSGGRRRRLSSLLAWTLMLPMAAAIVVVGADPAAAAPLVWYLDDVEVAGAGSASGSFTYDAANDTYSALDITYSDTPTLGTQQLGFVHPAIPGAAIQMLAVSSGGADLTNETGISLQFEDPLVGAGGTIDIRVGVSSVTYTCFNANCTAVVPNGGDDITGGRVTSTFAAEDDTAIAVTGVSTDIDVLTNDTGGATIGTTVGSVTSPSAGGTAVVVGDQIRYTPAGGFSGSETFDYTATSPFGPSSTATVTVTVPDTTAPTSAPTQSPPANADGWNNTDVDIFWNWTDDVGLGGNVCPAGTFIDTEGDPITETTTCTDAEGNTGTATYTVRIDTTPPVATPTQDAGVVTWNWTDNLSGTDNCDSTTATTAIGILNSSCTDLAGNTTNAAIFVTEATPDTTPPTAAPTQSPPANANGWNNTDVDIFWNWTDDLTGTDNCPIVTTAPLAGTEGADIDLTTICADAVGNTGTATYTVSVDKTPPVAAPTESNGVVTWNWTDSLSGTDNCDLTTTTSANGVFSSTCADLAGNATTESVVVDTTPPTANPTQNPPANANGWNNTDVTVTWNWTDSLSGTDNCTISTPIATEAANLTVGNPCFDVAGNVATATYTVSVDKTPPVAAPTQSNGVVTWNWTDSGSGTDNCDLATTGTAPNTVTSTCTDLAGNTTTETVTIADTTAPTAAPTQSPAANANGWNNTDVDIFWNWTDDIGLGANVCPAGTFIDTEGDPITETTTCTDAAGNTGTATYTVRIDTTPPVSASTHSPPANANGWNNTDVDIFWNWTDDLSGTDDCAISTNAPVFGAEGAGIQVSISCSDAAGNTGFSPPHTINIDKTPPVAAPTQTPAPNANGWNNTDVTVTWNWTDDFRGSGTDNCTISTVQSIEAGPSTVGLACFDVAGNVGEAEYQFFIDKTPPVAAPTESNGVVTWNWTDSLSGTDDCDITTTGTAPNTVTSICTDLAGNTTTETVTIADTTAPTAAPTQSPAANANGWNNTDVDIFWNWTDDVGLGANVCPAGTFIDTEGDPITETSTCTDAADNTGTATYTVRIDKTAPVAAPTEARTSAREVTVTFNWSDARSGVDPAACPVSEVVDGGAPAMVTATCTDLAGNTATVSYTVTTAADGLNPNLTISVSDGGFAFGANSTIVYQIDYANEGTGGVGPSIVLSVGVPEFTTANLAASTPGWTCSPVGPTGAVGGANCTLPPPEGLVPGETASVTFAVDVDSVIPPGNTATTFYAGCGTPPDANCPPIILPRGIYSSSQFPETDLSDNAASVVSTLVPSNTVPVAVDDAVTVTANRGNRIDVAANDIDPDPGDILTPTVVTEPTNGRAVVDSTEVVYTPATGFTGIDTFTYTVTDPEGETSNTATVSVTVEPMTVVLVAGKINPPGAGDRDAIRLTEGLGGFDVVLVDDDEADVRAAVLAENPGLVLLSSTVSITKIGNTLADLGTPLVTWEAYLHDELGLSDPNRNAETPANTNIIMTASGHPIADGFTAGSVRVTSFGQAQSFLIPAGDGTSIAVNPTVPSRSVLAAWDVGDATNRGPSPVRIVAFFTNYISLDRANDAGETLFEQSVIWAAAGEGIADATPNAAPTVDAGPGQTIRGALPALVDLDGTVTDDGLPVVPGTVTTMWEQISGPSAVIGDATAVDTSVEFTAAGVYVFELSAADGELTASDTVTIEFIVGSDPEILVVVGTLAPPRGDRDIVSHLEGLGAIVTLLDDDDVTASMDLAPYDAVFISTSVVISKVGDAFKTATIPVVTWEAYLFDDMGMGRSGESANLYTTISVVDTADPLAAGLTGSPTVYSRANKLSWAVVGAAADVVATEPGRSNRAVVFRYDSGDTLFDNSMAAGPRYGFFADYFGAQRLTTDGLAVLTSIYEEIS